MTDDRQGPESGDLRSTPPPETGDPAIDRATAALMAAPDELDEQMQAGEAVYRTLHARLSDLGG
ncbi:MAG: hypothetical protein ACRCW4_14645 [Candidatus Neomicrothrix subdominans]